MTMFANTQRGLSVIEMIVTIAITIVVSGVIVSSVLMFYRGSDYAIEQAFAVENARRGVEQMVRDIREASYSEEGAFPVIEIGTTTILFYSDIDRDEDVERIHFFLDGGTFRKGVAKPTGNPPTYDEDDDTVSIIAENVRNEEENTSIFEYFDSDGNAITNFNNVADVAFVRVSLIVNVNPIRLPNEFTLRSSATLRNLKINL